MKAQTVTYSRLFNLGNYENERIEITYELEDGDTPLEALDTARDEAETAHENFLQLRLQRENAALEDARQRNRRAVQQQHDAFTLELADATVEDQIMEDEDDEEEDDEEEEDDAEDDDGPFIV